MDNTEYELKLSSLDRAEYAINSAIEHIEVAGGNVELIKNLQFILEKGGALDAMRLNLDFKHKQNEKHNR